MTDEGNKNSLLNSQHNTDWNRAPLSPTADTDWNRAPLSPIADTDWNRSSLSVSGDAYPAYHSTRGSPSVGDSSFYTCISDTSLGSDFERTMVMSQSGKPEEGPQFASSPIFEVGGMSPDSRADVDTSSLDDILAGETGASEVISIEVTPDNEITQGSAEDTSAVQVTPIVKVTSASEVEVVGEGTTPAATSQNLITGPSDGSADNAIQPDQSNATLNSRDAGSSETIKNCSLTDIAVPSCVVLQVSSTQNLDDSLDYHSKSSTDLSEEAPVVDVREGSSIDVLHTTSSIDVIGSDHRALPENVVNVSRTRNSLSSEAVSVRSSTSSILVLGSSRDSRDFLHSSLEPDRSGEKSPGVSEPSSEHDSMLGEDDTSARSLTSSQDTTTFKGSPPAGITRRLAKPDGQSCREWINQAEPLPKQISVVDVDADDSANKILVVDAVRPEVSESGVGSNISSPHSNKSSPRSNQDIFPIETNSAEPDNRNLYPEVVVARVAQLEIDNAELEELMYTDPVEYVSSVESSPGIPNMLTTGPFTNSSNIPESTSYPSNYPEVDAEMAPSECSTEIPASGQTTPFTGRSESITSTCPSLTSQHGNNTASDLFISRIATILPKQDVVTITKKQKQMINKLECTNEKMRSCNVLSTQQLDKAQQNFKYYTQLLVEMRRDVETAFKRINSIKSKLSSNYPEIWELIMNSVQTDFIHPDDEADITSRTSSSSFAVVGPKSLDQIPTGSDGIKSAVSGDQDVTPSQTLPSADDVEAAQSQTRVYEIDDVSITEVS